MRQAIFHSDRLTCSAGALKSGFMVDPNVAAARAVEAATGLPIPTGVYAGLLARQKKKKAKDPAAVELGRRGGLKGGKARAKALTAKQRSEAARKAAEARWGRR